jgi:hypothetical protein
MPDATPLARVLTELAVELPGSTLTNSAKHQSFMIGNEVFAYTRGNDVVPKLPAQRIEQLLHTMDASILVMGKRAMKEWVVIRHKDPQAFRNDLALFEQAMAFVRG